MILKYIKFQIEEMNLIFIMFINKTIYIQLINKLNRNLY